LHDTAAEVIAAREWPVLVEDHLDIIEPRHCTRCGVIDELRSCERGARAVVSISAEKLARFREMAAKFELGILDIGRVTRGDFQIKINGSDAIAAPCSKLRESWGGSFPALMAG